MQTNNDQFVKLTMDLLPCLGCRSSADALFQEIGAGDATTGFLDGSGLEVLPNGCLKLSDEYCHDPDEALKMFNHYEKWGSKSVAKLGRSGKSLSRSRCFLHSQRGRTPPRPDAFEALWGKLTTDNRHTLAQVDADQFLTDLECYLRRHRFCCRCKEKVAL